MEEPNRMSIDASKLYDCTVDHQLGQSNGFGVCLQMELHQRREQVIQRHESIGCFLQRNDNLGEMGRQKH